MAQSLGSDMRWNFDAWLCQHRAEIEAQWLAAVQGLPAYVDLPPEERLACWSSLVDDLVASRADTPEEWVGRWAAREMDERGATPPELLAIAESLSHTVRDLLPADADLSQVNGRVNALGSALAHYFAGQVELLAAEKSRLETLYEITRELSASLDLGRMLHRTLDAVVPATSPTFQRGRCASPCCRTAGQAHRGQSGCTWRGRPAIDDRADLARLDALESARGRV